MTAHPPLQQVGVMERGFEVTVRGRLEPRFAARFGPTVVETRGPRTTVRGHYVDQSNLDGILAYFRDMGMELLSLDTWDEPGTKSLSRPEANNWNPDQQPQGEDNGN